MKQGKKLLTGATLMLALSAGQANAASPLISFSPANTVVADNTKFVSKRPAEADRLFVSDAVEKKIKEVTPSTPPLILMAKTTPLFTQATFMPCGFETVAHRYGPTCSIVTKMPS